MVKLRRGYYRQGELECFHCGQVVVAGQLASERNSILKRTVEPTVAGGVKERGEERGEIKQRTWRARQTETISVVKWTPCDTTMD